LNAWRTECGFPTLAVFADSCPSPKQLLELAAQILNKYATPMEEHEKQRESSTTAAINNHQSVCSDESDGSDKGTASDPSESASEVSSSASNGPNLQDNHAHHNICLLTHDLLKGEHECTCG